jgi:hypothetical protein
MRLPLPCPDSSVDNNDDRVYFEYKDFCEEIVKNKGD